MNLSLADKVKELSAALDRKFVYRVWLRLRRGMDTSGVTAVPDTGRWMQVIASGEGYFWSSWNRGSGCLLVYVFSHKRAMTALESIRDGFRLSTGGIMGGKFFDHNYSPWDPKYGYKLAGVWNHRGEKMRIAMFPPADAGDVFNTKQMRDVITTNTNLYFYLFMTPESQAVERCYIGVVNGRTTLGLMVYNQEQLSELWPRFDRLTSNKKVLLLAPKRGECPPIPTPEQLARVNGVLVHGRDEEWLEAVGKVALEADRRVVGV